MSASQAWCTPSVQASCCEPSAKESCCGTTAAATTGESSTCGCAEGQSTAQASTGSDPDDPEELPVAVIGAGPVGLAAAAHLLEYGQHR